MVRLMDNDEHTGPINIGNPTEFTMLELANVVKEVITSVPLLIKTYCMQSANLSSKRPNVTLFSRILTVWCGPHQGVSDQRAKQITVGKER